MTRTRSFAGAVVLASALSVLACSSLSDEEKGARHLEQGRRYAAEGRHAEALLELRNAVTLLPRDVDAHRALAGALSEAGDTAGAFREFREVVTLDASDLEARLYVAEQLGRAGQHVEAETHAARAAELAPDRYEPHLYLARARAGQEDCDGAAAQLDTAVALAPGNPGLVSEMADLLVFCQRAEDALELLRSGVDRMPDSVDLRAAVLETLTVAGRWEEARRARDDLLAVAPQDPAALQLAAGFELRRGRPGPARDFLKQALANAERDPSRRMRLLIVLANLDMALGRLDGVEGWLAQLASIDGAASVALARRADLRLLRDDLPGARAALGELAKQDPDGVNTRLLQARIMLGSGLFSEARGLLDAIAKDHPDSLNAHLFLAKALAGQYLWAESRIEYLKVLEQVPHHVFARLDLAEVCLQLGRETESLEHVDQVLAVRAGDPRALTLRARAFLRLGRGKEALAIAGQLMDELPADPGIRTLWINALAVTGQEERAVKAARDAARTWPGEQSFVILEIDVLAKRGRVKEMRARADRYTLDQGVRPQVMNAVARHLREVGDETGSLDYLERGLAVSPDDPDCLETRAQVRIDSGALDGAANDLRRALESDPARLSAHLRLAGVLTALGRVDEAKDAYERVLQQSPGHPVAANNLASLLLETEAGVSRAVMLAQQALDRDAENPIIRDTLGWAMYRAGGYAAARHNLEEARRGLPQHPEVAFHLGMVYAKLGKDEMARRLLEEATEQGQGTWVFEAREALTGLELGKQ